MDLLCKLKLILLLTKLTRVTGRGDGIALVPLHPPDPSRLVLKECRRSCQPDGERIAVQHVRTDREHSCCQYLPQG